MEEPHHRKIRSFVRRPGRITSAQGKALADLMPRLGVAPADTEIDLNRIYGRDAPRVMDIGFGDGEALLTSAANNPSLDYLGIEVHEPGIGHLLLLLERGGLNNVRIINRDAVEVLSLMISKHSFDAVNLFFPDPWPKKRHHKRRLIQAAFVVQLARALKRGGLLHIATDWADYAEHVAAVMSACGEFLPVDPKSAESDPLSYRPPTKFERRGRMLGHDVTDLYYRTSAGSDSSA